MAEIKQQPRVWHLNWSDIRSLEGRGAYLYNPKGEMVAIIFEQDRPEAEGVTVKIMESLNATASPTESDNGELLELYAKSITTHSPDMVQDFRAGRVSSVAIALLTKFANAMRPPLAQLDQEIVERYAKLAMSIPAGVFRAAVDDDDEDLDRMKRVLTRFASEIGVDAERQKLVDELVAAAIAWQEIEPACGCGGECHFDRLHNAIKSLKAAGGGK